MEIKVWNTLGRFLKKRTLYPLSSPSFILYFVFIIIIVGSFGLFYDLKDSYFGYDYEIDPIKARSIIMNMTNIGLSLAAASIIELLFVSKKKLSEEEKEIDNKLNRRIEIANYKIKFFSSNIELYLNKIEQKKKLKSDTPQLPNNRTEKDIKILENKVKKERTLIQKWESKLNRYNDKLQLKDFEKNFGYEFVLIKRDISVFGISCLILQFVFWILANEVIKERISLKIIIGTISLFLGYYVWWISNAKNKLLISEDKYDIDGREIGGTTNSSLTGSTEGYNIK